MSPTPTPLFTGALSQATLKAAVHDLLAGDAVQVPTDHKGELVTVLNHDKIEVVLATRVADTTKLQWDLNVVASHAWSGENSFGVLSRVTLK